MFEALEIGSGLDMVLWFQENRTAWMEVMVKILDQAGYDLVYVALFGLVFWAINKRHGIRLIFALVIVGVVSFALKDILMRPRPYLVSDLVNPVFETDGFGIPSGHTSITVMIWGYIALWVRKGWVWVVAISYMLLQGLGRIIAGVHFPQDVLAGFLVGIVTLAIYYPMATRWETIWNRQSFNIRIAIAVMIPLILAIIVISLALDTEQSESYLTMFGLALGAGIGTAIETRYIQFRPSPALSKQALVYVLGGILIVVTLLGLSPLFDLIAETGTVAYILRIVRYALAVIIGFTLVPLLGIQLNLMEKNQETVAVKATV